MVRVAIGVGAYPNDLRTRSVYIALSIDEPIPTEFLAEAPEKIWCLYTFNEEWAYTGYLYLYPKILDIPEGTHTIYLAVYSPETIPWKVFVAAYGTTQNKAETTWLYKGLTDTITINVNPAGAPYPRARLPSFELAELVSDGMTYPEFFCEPALTNIYPRLYSAYEGCVSEVPLSSCLEGTLSYATFISCFKGEQFLVQLPIIATEGIYTFGHLWWNIKEANYPYGYRRVSAIPIRSPSPYITDRCRTDCVWLLPADLYPFFGPLYVARDLTPTDTITLQVGHIENDTLPPDQWTYVLDQEYSINLYNRSTTACPTPPSPAGANLRIKYIVAYPEAPIDIRPGRRLFIFAIVENTGTVGCWPYISVNEGPLTFQVGDPATYIEPGYGTALTLTTLIDDKIASQRYVTVNIGYYKPAPSYPSGILVGGMVTYILQTIQVPLYTTDAEILDVKLETTAPQIGARIDNVTLEAVAPAIAARIDNVSLAAVTPPPPPPAEYATIAGRVLGFLGPVANAEVSLDTKYTTKTKADGSYTLTNIPLGSYTLTAKPTSLLDKILYSPASTKVDALAPVTITKNISLPANWKALAAGAGGISIAAVVAATKIKPKPPAVY